MTQICGLLLLLLPLSTESAGGTPILLTLAPSRQQLTQTQLERSDSLGHVLLTSTNILSYGHVFRSQEASRHSTLPQQYLFKYFVIPTFSFSVFLALYNTYDNVC